MELSVGSRAMDPLVLVAAAAAGRCRLVRP
jgi:hypothetical protein